MSEKSVPKRQYTDEFKIEAVWLAESVGQHEAARRLGVPVATLGDRTRCNLRSDGAGKARGHEALAKRATRPISELEAERKAGCVRSWPARNSISKFCQKRRRTSRRGAVR
jgi:transposase